MEVDKIYFDMDGVLADFQKGLTDILHIAPIDQANHTPEQDDEMYAKMRECDGFYNRLEPIEGTIGLFEELYAKYGNKCEILSGIPKPFRGIVNSASEKREWVRRYLPSGIVVNTVLRREKKNYVSRPGHILIDDYEKNLREWREGGGTGVLFVNAEDARKRLKDLGIL